MGTQIPLIYMKRYDFFKRIGTQIPRIVMKRYDFLLGILRSYLIITIRVICVPMYQITIGTQIPLIYMKRYDFFLGINKSYLVINNLHHLRSNFKTITPCPK